ncbi:MAG: APC family permease [Mycoplasmoidaceae bacterium]|nr:APC family permease [Mycoplasmoidaceae bacterium]
MPLAFCIIAGIVIACMGLGGEHSIAPVAPEVGSHVRLAQMFAPLGVIGSIPAIIFSYDGFYSAAGIQSEMEEPKKTPLALVVGLLIVSAINLLIAVALLFGSENGKVNHLG